MTNPPSRSSLVITQLHIDPEAVHVSYGLMPEDLRDNGVAYSHGMAVPIGSDYDEEIDDVIEALKSLVLDVIADLQLTEPVSIEELQQGAEKSDDDTEEDGDDDD